jgi:transposase
VALAERIQQLIERDPTFGYRRVWALLSFTEGIRVHPRAVYRVLRLKGWFGPSTHGDPASSGSGP